MQHPDEPSLVTRKEAASMLGISVDSLDRLVEDHELPVLRFGRAVRIQQKDVAALIQRRRAAPRRPSRPRCSRCRRRITGPRLVVGGLWVCSSCMYEMERGGGIEERAIDVDRDEPGDEQPA